MLRPVLVLLCAVAIAALMMIHGPRLQAANDAQDVNIKRVAGVLVNPGGVLTGTFTDRSGAITSGGVSQTLAAASGLRMRIMIENPCTATSQNIATAESLFINFTSAAAANSTSVELAPCGSFDTASGPVTTEAITVIGATTAHKWISKEILAP